MASYLVEAFLELLAVVRLGLGGSDLDWVVAELFVPYLCWRSFAGKGWEQVGSGPWDLKVHCKQGEQMVVFVQEVWMVLWLRD